MRQTQRVSKFIEIFCVLIYWLRKFKTTQIRFRDSITVQVPVRNNCLMFEYAIMTESFVLNT